MSQLLIPPSLAHHKIQPSNEELGNIAAGGVDSHIVTTSGDYSRVYGVVVSAANATGNTRAQVSLVVGATLLVHSLVCTGATENRLEVTLPPGTFLTTEGGSNAIFVSVSVDAGPGFTLNGVRVSVFWEPVTEPDYSP